MALAETGQRTGMGDIAETDEKTLFSEAYLLHKISMCRMKRTAGRKKKQTNSLWSNSFSNIAGKFFDGRWHFISFRSFVIAKIEQ